MKINKTNENKIQRYAEMDGTAPDDFLNSMLSEALTSHEIMRAGGMCMTIPNPQFFSNREDKVNRILTLLSECAFLCRYMSIPFRFDLLHDFLEERLYSDSDELRARFEKNLNDDLAYSAEESADNN